MHEAADLKRMIAALWDDARPRLLARVETLEALIAGPLTAADQQLAYAEAHTLTGTLGAFGRVDASAAARAAEQAAQDGDRAALAAAVRALRDAL